MNGKTSQNAFAGGASPTPRFNYGHIDPSIPPALFRAVRLYWKATKTVRKVDWNIVWWVVLTMVVVAYALTSVIGTMQRSHISLNDGPEHSVSGSYSPFSS